MRALEFCLNFYNKNPKTVALITKKPALGLSSDWLVTWATNLLGQAQSLVGTALAPHRSAFLQNGIGAILLFCFKQKTVSCPIQNIRYRLNGVLRILLGFCVSFLVWLNQYMVQPKLINVIFKYIQVALVINLWGHCYAKSYVYSSRKKRYAEPCCSPDHKLWNQTSWV